MRHPPDGVGAFFMSIIRQHPKKHNPKAVPLGGRGTALVVEGGNSLSNQDCPTTNAPIPATAKQEPEMSRPPWGKGDRASGGRGELALNPRLLHSQRTHPSDCEAGARKSRPPWGKGDRASGGRGGLALNLRLPHNQRTHPKNCRSKKQHQIRKAIQHRKRAPPHRALTGPPPTQRGRLNYSP